MDNSRLAVREVVPGMDAWDRADARFALAFWPWSLLAQPESLLTAGARAIVKDALEQWDTPASAFPPAVRQAYERALQDPQHAAMAALGVRRDKAALFQWAMLGALQPRRLALTRSQAARCFQALAAAR